MSEAEQFYDAEIAPALAAIAKKCEERGMSIAAMVEYEPGECGSTRLIQSEASLMIHMVQLCILTAPNIDSYMMNLARYCRQEGIDTSASMYLNVFKNRE